MKSGKETRKFDNIKGGWMSKVFFDTEGKKLVLIGKRITGIDFESGKEHFSWFMSSEKNAFQGKKTDDKGRSSDDPIAEGIYLRAKAISPNGKQVAYILPNRFSSKPLKDRLQIAEVETGKVIHKLKDSGREPRDMKTFAFHQMENILLQPIRMKSMFGKSLPERKFERFKVIAAKSLWFALVEMGNRSQPQVMTVRF
jgi:hypothetical protein